MIHYIKKTYSIWMFAIVAIFSLNCKDGNAVPDVANILEEQENTFKSDYNFLDKYLDVVLLEDRQGKGKIAISPELQARVMTSTANGWEGNSYGWINKTLFNSGDTLGHINAYGGEERLWLGPEGGQYSIFFKKGDEFTLDNWQTPRLIDLEPFELVERTTNSAKFSKAARLTNYSGFTFEFVLERSITILSENILDSILQMKPDKEVKTIGYVTRNILKNNSSTAWQKETGLLSIWILGMLKHSPETVVIIPYNTGDESKLGPVVNGDYFGKVPSDRLKVGKSTIFFKADGQQRGKIGLSPLRSKDLLGSYDPKASSLTIIKYNKPEHNIDYLNSKWEIQKEPYRGDAVNAYNDGPPEPGIKPLGPFYELETSSPAAALSAGEKIFHVQYTLHLEGNEKDLNVISLKVLGVSLKEIRTVFK
jgi:hypothetical protein